MRWACTWSEPWKRQGHSGGRPDPPSEFCRDAAPLTRKACRARLRSPKLQLLGTLLGLSSRLWSALGDRLTGWACGDPFPLAATPRGLEKTRSFKLTFWLLPGQTHRKRAGVILDSTLDPSAALSQHPPTWRAAAAQPQRNAHWAAALAWSLGAGGHQVNSTMGSWAGSGAGQGTRTSLCLPPKGAQPCPHCPARPPSPQ